MAGYTNTDYIMQCALTDTNIDVVGGAIQFVDFYDSIFEVVDGNT